MMKKRLNDDQEFEIMKLVLDKFLWLGFGIMGAGIFVTLFSSQITKGLVTIGAGAVILIIFLIVIVREYEIIQ